MVFWLDYDIEVLLRVEVNPGNVDFAIKWPSRHETEECAGLTARNRENGHLLPGGFAVLDGRAMPCAKYSDLNLQNAFWEAFTHSDEATNLFCVNPER